jgi:hypothetical protein
MLSLEDEELVIKLLAEKRLRAERFSKTERRQGKTPDFRVFSGETLKFYCEVKSIENDTWLEDQLAVAAPSPFAGGGRNDPVFGRLTDDIHKAAAQFAAVNPDGATPNVLVFVNHDSRCNEQDLIGVVTGQFLADDGSAHRIYQKFSEGRIRDEKHKVGLYSWVEDGRFRAMFFNQHDPNVCNELCRLFGHNPSSIRAVPPLTSDCGVK